MSRKTTPVPTPPKSNKRTKAKAKTVAIKKPLATMTRGELNVLSRTLEIQPEQYANKTSLIEALKPLVREPKAAKPAAKKGSTKRKVDWNKAFAWFIEDHTRSYSDVAKQFGVTKHTVEQNAKVTYKDDTGATVWATWSERRHLLGENARKKAEEDYKKTAPVRSQQHLLQYRNLQVAVSQKVTALAAQGEILVNPTTGKRVKVQEFDARQLADAAKALKLAVDGERVIMGLPTSVSTIKPGADDETGKGWGELLALAMKQASDTNE